jgi:hypothetical protein
MLIMKRKLLTLAITGVLAAAGFVVDGVLNLGILTSDAEAIVGRPRTPVSAAGVARRTTRRVIRRTTVRIATLPAAHTVVVIEGVTLYKVNTTYYQLVSGQYVVVVID